MDADAEAMRAFWEARAEENAAFYVDTSMAYDDPDMVRFFATGEQVVDEALGRAPVQPARYGTAVEIGSGLGRICKALAGEFDQVVGVDISPAMVRRARELVDDPKVRFEVGDGASLPMLDDASVDFACTFTVFQHQRSRDLIAAYLRECGRTITPGGVLAAQWNNLPPLRYRLDTLRWRLRRRRLDAVRAVTTEPEFRGTTASVRWMRRRLDEAGFDVVEVRGAGTLFAWVWGVRRADR